jgi:hypothetical protein
MADASRRIRLFYSHYFIDRPATQTSFLPTNTFSARIDKISFGGSLVMSVKSRVGLASLPWSVGSVQNSKYPSVPVGRGRPSLSLAGSKPTIPRRLSQAAWFRDGSAPTSSRIIFHAAILSAPSGGGPIARETEHWGQKQIRFAADFCRGLTPTVWANMYTATDLCPASISRLQRRQNRFSKGSFLAAGCGPRKYSLHVLPGRKVRRKIPARPRFVADSSRAVAKRASPQRSAMTRFNKHMTVL